MKKIKQAPVRKKREQVFGQELLSLRGDIETYNRMFTDLTLRLSALEGYLLDTQEDFTLDSFRQRVMALQDAAIGYVPEKVIAAGDRVRVVGRFRPSTESDFAEELGETRITLEDVGVGVNLPASLEAQIIGMEVGETKTFDFFDPATPDTILVAQIGVITIARKVRKEAEVEN